MYNIGDKVCITGCRPGCQGVENRIATILSQDAVHSHGGIIGGSKEDVDKMIKVLLDGQIWRVNHDVKMQLIESKVLYEIF